jgi:hypothetical protein
MGKLIMKLNIFISIMLFLNFAVSAEKIPHYDIKVFRPKPGSEFKINKHKGKIIAIEDFDLTTPNAKWDTNGCVKMKFVKGKKFNFHRMEITKRGYLMNMSTRNFPIKPNRKYILSALIRCNFPREKKFELNMGMMMLNKGRSVLYNLNGVPARTDGWVRWEFCFNSYQSTEVWASPSKTDEPLVGRFYMRPFVINREKDFKAFKVDIADIKFIELPPEKIIPFKTGEGVTFPGGPGALPMKVESCSDNNDIITVETTGAKYLFDKKNSTITAWQKIGRQRQIACFKTSVPLKNLKIIRDNNKECVLVNDTLTFGIQCDSMVFIAPQKKLTLDLQGEIAGEFSRLITGHLLVIDNWGGLAVNPALPLGTGKIANAELSGKLTDSKWNAAWEIAPGERIAFSVFPPRPFDWKKSFDFNFSIIFERDWSDKQVKEFSKYINSMVLWSGYFYCGYAMSYGPDTPKLHPRWEKAFHSTVKRMKKYGIEPLTFMSFYFYYSRNPEEFINELKRVKKEFGVTGIYYDGVPSQDWVLAYKIMRMTREVFPHGDIILHSTGQPYNGGPPFARPDIFIPAIDTYATATVRLEGIKGSGKVRPLVKYISSQYRKANCIGQTKAGVGVWKGFSAAQQKLLILQHNGRDRNNPKVGSLIAPEYKDVYWPVKNKLKKLWEKNKGNPNFYEEIYIPAVKELIKPYL